MTKPILYQYWRSSCSWRVRWALDLKGVAYESRVVNLLNSEQRTQTFRRLNPSGLVPALILPTGECLTQSIAILEYLEEAYQVRPLLPSSPIERAQVRTIVGMVASDIQPIQNLRVLRYVASDARAREQFARHWIASGLEPIEETLRSTAGTFCVGSQLSLADLCLIPQCYNAQRFGIDLGQYPCIARVHANCERLPSYPSAHPDQQPKS